MTKGLLLIIGLALAGGAQAQIKCWTGADGKRACGDSPPPGARLETPKGAPRPVPASTPAPAPAPAPQYRAPAATPATKAPPAPTPQELAKRKREAEAQQAATKAYLNRTPSSGNMQDCERAREKLRAMGRGGSSQRTDAVKARALAENNCR